MNNTERFMGVMSFEKVDKFPLLANMSGGAYNVAVEGSVTANRWHSEAFPAASSAADFFSIGFTFEQLPVSRAMIPPFPPETLYERDRYVVLRDGDGVKKRVFKTRSSVGVLQWGMPQFLDFPVKNKRDWGQLKQRFDPADPGRLGVEWGDELVKHYETTSKPVYVGISGLFAWCRGLMGLERFLMALCRDEISSTIWWGLGLTSLQRSWNP